MFATLLETSDTSLIEKAVTHYRERYSETGVYETQAYRGISEMLTAVRRLVPACLLATSKPTVFANRIVQHLGFESSFERIYGVELDGRFDNKAELLEHLLVQENIAPESAVMIGDRAADILAAKANRIPSIGVLWGYGSAEELQTAGAGTLCASPEELIKNL
jgi:phosphoglycolate phosphatase